MALVSYVAPSPVWDPSVAYQQKTYRVQTGTFGPGTHTLTVQLPNTYYQVDFVCGPVIDQLLPSQNGNAYGPDSANITYSSQGRLLSADNDGTTAPAASALNTKSPSVPTPTATSTASQTMQDSAVLSGGYIPTGTITFYLFAPGITPNATNSNNVYTYTATVSGNGTYTTGNYTPTAAGTYQWVAVYGGDGNNKPVTSPYGSEPWVVGVTAASITGTVFCDDNLNGTYQSTPLPGEGLEKGAVVGLYSGNTLLTTATTDAAGMYAFTNVTPGTYTVKLVTPSAGHVAELVNGAATVHTVTVGAGGVAAGYNFAEVQLGSVSGTVYLDVNDSGVQGDVAGEAGIPNVCVTLTGTNYLGAAVSLTTKTDANGLYSFSGLLPSNAAGYTVKETQPAGYLDGTDTPGPWVAWSSGRRPARTTRSPGSSSRGATTRRSTTTSASTASSTV